MPAPFIPITSKTGSSSDSNFAIRFLIRPRHEREPGRVVEEARIPFRPSDFSAESRRPCTERLQGFGRVRCSFHSPNRNVKTLRTPISSRNHDSTFPAICKKLTGTIVAQPSDDKSKRVKRVKQFRVRLGDNGCGALWGRRFTTERWRLFRGNRVASPVEEQKGRAADKRPDEARGSLAGFISGPQAFRTLASFQGGKKSAAGSIEPTALLFFAAITRLASPSFASSDFLSAFA